MGRIRMGRIERRVLYTWILTGFLLVCVSCGQKPGMGTDKEPGAQEGVDKIPGTDRKEEQASEGSEYLADEEAPLLLKVATTKIPESTGYQGLEMLKDKIERESGGTIEVQLYPSEQLGEWHCGDGLFTGRVCGGVISGDFYSGLPAAGRGGGRRDLPKRGISGDVGGNASVCPYPVYGFFRGGRA